MKSTLGLVESKVCFRCKKNKSLTEFRQYKSGINKGYYSSYCRQCNKDYLRQYSKDRPWIKYYDHSKFRCCYSTQKRHKYYKNLEFNMTPNDFKFLWFRDRAWLLEKASIDRIDSKKEYNLNNCRFIELKQNQLQGLKERWDKFARDERRR
jgi:hypothetical protein